MTDAVAQQVAALKTTLKMLKAAVPVDKVAVSAVRKAYKAAKARLKAAPTPEKATPVKRARPLNEAPAPANEAKKPRLENDVAAAAAGEGGPPAAAVEDEEVAKLEAAYRTALAAFKADKKDKDLRRAKSAARKAWDAAVAAKTDGEPLMCRDCSCQFMFTTEEAGFYEEKGYPKPKRCPNCREAMKSRREGSRARKDNNSKGKNMCYAFQRGECTRGAMCKFSHDMAHGGKKSAGGGVCFDFVRGNCKRGDKCRFNHVKPSDLDRALATGPKREQKETGRTKPPAAAAAPSPETKATAES